MFVLTGPDYLNIQTNPVSNRRVRFEKKLSVNGSLRLRIYFIGLNPTGNSKGCASDANASSDIWRSIIALIAYERGA